MQKVSVIEAARAANGFRREHWRDALGPALLLVLIALVRALTGDDAPTWTVVGGLAQWAAYVMAYGALLRIAFGDLHPDDPAYRRGPLGLQWGQVEWRLLGVFAIDLAILLGLAVAIAAFAELLLARSGGAASPGVKASVALVAIVVYAAALYILVRLSLAAPGSVARGEFFFLRSWPLTGRAIWSIVGVYLLILALLIGLCLIAIFGAIAIANLSAPLLLQGAGPGLRAQALDQTQKVWTAAFVSVVLTFVGLPLNAGVSAYLYRALNSGAEPS